MREQLERLNAALDAAKVAAKDKDLKLEELGRELNLALAARVKDSRALPLGILRPPAGGARRARDVQVVGDRFVFSSGALPSASDEVSADGMIQLARLAETLKTLSGEMPKDLPRVLRVDGHTDRRPIATARFPSNWGYRPRAHSPSSSSCAARASPSAWPPPATASSTRWTRATPGSLRAQPPHRAQADESTNARPWRPDISAHAHLP